MTTDLIIKTEPYKALLSKAQNGDVDAQYWLGYCYFEGRGGALRDEAQAVHWWTLASEQSNSGKAMYRLGFCFQFHHGVPRDSEQAKLWYDRAQPGLKREAESDGDAESQFLLGQSFETGRGAPLDRKQAEIWLRKAADQDHVDAQFELGNHDNISLPERIVLLVGAAKHGNHGAKILLGKHLEEWSKTYMISMDYRKKEVSVLKAIADCFGRGIGVAEDAERAKTFNEKAASLKPTPRLLPIRGAKRKPAPRFRPTHHKVQTVSAVPNKNITQKPTPQRGGAQQMRPKVPEKSAPPQESTDLSTSILNKLRAPPQKTQISQANHALGDTAPENQDPAPTKATDQEEQSILAQAEAGDAISQYRIACIYHKGNRDALAAEWWGKAAAQGSGIAMCRLGHLNRHFKKDKQEAEKWFRKAIPALVAEAEQGLAEAQFLLGQSHEQGLGVAKNYEIAVEWWQCAAAQNHAEAQQELGGSFEYGAGVEKDLGVAAEWYIKAAENGQTGALRCLGWMAKNSLQFLEHKTNDPKILNALAHCYQHGHGVDQDAARSEKLRQQAKDIPKAGFFEDGVSGNNNISLDSTQQTLRATAVSVSRFRDCLSKAKKGDKDAQYLVGCFFFEGQGVAKNEAVAARWWGKATMRGSVEATIELAKMKSILVLDRTKTGKFEIHFTDAKKGDRESQYVVALFFHSGAVVQHDSAKAFHWWSKAADQGCGKAMFRLGYCYLCSCGVEKDQKAGEKWYRLAFSTLVAQAEQGDAESQFLLGECFEQGRGTAPDHAKSLHLLALAADQDHVEAQYKLGEVYEYGIYVERNLGRTVEWYRRAAENGETDSKRKLKSLAKKLVAAEEHNTTDPRALNALAYCYMNGLGVVFDEQRAVELKKRAVPSDITVAPSSGKTPKSFPKTDLLVETKTPEQLHFTGLLMQAKDGDLEAQYLVADRYFWGMYIGNYRGNAVGRDEAQSVRWWSEAASQGSGKAMQRLSNCFRFGHGATKDETKADKLIQQAIPVLKTEASGKVNDSESQYLLGWCYSCGWGVSKDEKQAVELFQKAAEQDHPDAQHELGCCFQHGNGVEVNMGTSAGWFLRALENSQKDAHNSLGFFASEYLDDRHRPPKQQEDPQVLNALAYCFYYGIGVGQNTARARELWLESFESEIESREVALVSRLFGGVGGKEDDSETASFSDEEWV